MEVRILPLPLLREGGEIGKRALLRHVNLN